MPTSSTKVAHDQPLGKFIVEAPPGSQAEKDLRYKEASLFASMEKLGQTTRLDALAIKDWVESMAG